MGESDLKVLITTGESSCGECGGNLGRMPGSHWWKARAPCAWHAPTRIVSIALVTLSLGLAACGPTPTPKPVPPRLVSVRPTAGSLVLHPQWTSYTNADLVADLLPVGDDLWAATSGGVLHWNLADGTCMKYISEHGLASNRVLAIAVDGDVALWFGTWWGGVSRFRPD